MPIRPATHAFTVNGISSSEVRDWDEPHEEVIRQCLTRLNGTSFFALSMWALPPETEFDRVDVDEWSQAYIQVAGSAERMMVEMRRLESDVYRQYVIGRQATVRGWPMSRATVLWDGRKTKVAAHEAFNASGAADLFIAYLHTGTVPDEYSLRLLDL